MRIESQRELFALARFIRESAFRWDEQDPLEFERRKKALEALHFMASKLKVNSQTMYGRPDKLTSGRHGYIYSPKRAEQQEQANEFFWNTGGPENILTDEYGNPVPHGANGVPSEGKAVLMAGLPGSGKSTVLNHPEVRRILTPENFYRWNVDPPKYWMGYNGMIPSLDETLKALEGKGVSPEMTQKIYRALGGYASPMDMSPLVHGEATDMAKRLLRQLQAERKNVVIDGTLAKSQSAFEHLKNFGENDYGDLYTMLVSETLPRSEARAASRYTQGDERHRSGEPEKDWKLFFPGVASPGGRYVPPFVSRANAPSLPGSWSASEDVYRSLDPFINNALETDARRNPEGNRVLVRGGKGPMYENWDWDHGVGEDDPFTRSMQKLVDPATGKPFQLSAGINGYDLTFYQMEGGAGMVNSRIASNPSWQKLMADRRAERAGSFEEIVERYGSGAFDFDMLVKLIQERYRKLAVERAVRESRMRHEERAADEWWDDAPGPDDLYGVLRQAVRDEILSRDELQAIEDSL